MARVVPRGAGGRRHLLLAGSPSWRDVHPVLGAVTAFAASLVDDLAGELRPVPPEADHRRHVQHERRAS